jgi:predicted membrane protein
VSLWLREYTEEDLQEHFESNGYSNGHKIIAILIIVMVLACIVFEFLRASIATYIELRRFLLDWRAKKNKKKAKKVNKIEYETTEIENLSIEDDNKNKIKIRQVKKNIVTITMEGG